MLNIFRNKILITICDLTTSFWINFNIPEVICEPTYVITTRGNRQLDHNGYRYRKDRDSSKGTRWRCAKFLPGCLSCKGKAYTYNSNGMEYATFSGSHDHPPKHWNDQNRKNKNVEIKYRKWLDFIVEM